MIGGFISGGAGTGKAKVDAQDNVTLGTSAGLLLSTGDDDNIAIGTNALKSTTTNSDNNIAIGTSAGTLIETGDNNICIGTDAGAALTSEGNNTIIGGGAGAAATTQSGVFIGRDCIKGATVGLNDVVIGATACDAVSGNLGDNSVIIGAAACGTATTAGFTDSDVIIGRQACNNSGYNSELNTVVGHQAAPQLTTGEHNTFLGAHAGYTQTTCDTNIAIGYYSGIYSPTTWNGHISLGFYGLFIYDNLATMSTYNAAQGDDNTAASVAKFKIPQYSCIRKVSVVVHQKGEGTHVYSISMGTASDEAIGDSVAGRVELVGADVGTGITTRSSATKDSATNIDASTGANEKAVWVSEMSPGTNNFTGWCDTDMYVYVTNAGTSNSESDPGDDPVLGIQIEYFGKE